MASSEGRFCGEDQNQNKLVNTRLYFLIKRNPLSCFTSSNIRADVSLWSVRWWWCRQQGPQKDIQVTKQMLCPGSQRCMLCTRTMFLKNGCSVLFGQSATFCSSVGSGRTGFKLKVSEYQLLAFVGFYVLCASDCYLLKLHSNRAYPSGSLHSQ